MDGGGPLQLSGVALGDPQVADQPLVDQLGHRSHGLFHGDLRVHPVQVVEVDVIRAETCQRRLAVAADPLRTSIEAYSVFVADDAELGGERDLVPMVRKRPGQQALVVPGSVALSCVPEGHAEFDGPVQGGEGFMVVGLAVTLRHAHASQAR